MVFTSRPFHERDEYMTLVDSRHVEVVSLKPLAADDGFVQLVQQCMGTENVRPSVINLIRDKSDGNPLITRELSYSLLNKGFLMFRTVEILVKGNHGQQKLSAISETKAGNGKGDDCSELREVTVCMFNPRMDLICPVPHTVHGIITARLDRLLKEDPRLVILMKTAAVIQIQQQSQVFNFGMLMDCYPVDVKKHTHGLASAVSRLESQRLITRVNHQNDGLEILDLSLMSASSSSPNAADSNVAAEASDDSDADSSTLRAYQSAKSRAALRDRLRRVAFRFSHGFTGDVLRQTVTDAQLKLLMTRADTATELQEERIRLRWLEATVGKQQAMTLHTHLAGAWCDVLKDTDGYNRAMLALRLESNAVKNTESAGKGDGRGPQLTRGSSAPGDLLRALGSRWKRRWVVLDTNSSDLSAGQLLLYRNPEDCSKDPSMESSRKPPLQRIFLRGAEVLTRPAVHTSRDCFELRCQKWTKDGKEINHPRAFYFGSHPKGIDRGKRHHKNRSSAFNGVMPSAAGASTYQKGAAVTQDSSQWVFMIKLAIQRTQLEDLRAKHRALDPDLAEVARQERNGATHGKHVSNITHEVVLNLEKTKQDMMSNPMRTGRKAFGKKQTLSGDARKNKSDAVEMSGPGPLGRPSFGYYKSKIREPSESKSSRTAAHATDAADAALPTLLSEKVRPTSVDTPATILAEKVAVADNAEQDMIQLIQTCQLLAAKLAQNIAKNQKANKPKKGFLGLGAADDSSGSALSFSAKEAARVSKELVTAVFQLEKTHKAVRVADTMVRDSASTSGSRSQAWSAQQRKKKDLITRSVSENNLQKSPTLRRLLAESNTILDQNSKSFILDYVRNPGDHEDDATRLSSLWMQDSDTGRFDSVGKDLSSSLTEARLSDEWSNTSGGVTTGSRASALMLAEHQRGSSGEIVWGYNSTDDTRFGHETSRGSVSRKRQGSRQEQFRLSRTSNIPLSVKSLSLHRTSTRVNAALSMWGFDVFAISRTVPLFGSEADVERMQREQLNQAVLTMFRGFDILTTYSIPNEVFITFVSEISMCYHASNPYHNYYHAVDVMQTVYCFIASMNARSMLRHVDIFALMVAALAHDVDHPGTNNTFHVKARTELALR